ADFAVIFVAPRLASRSRRLARTGVLAARRRWLVRSALRGVSFLVHKCFARTVQSGRRGESQAGQSGAERPQRSGRRAGGGDLLSTRADPCDISRVRARETALAWRR